MATQQDRAAVIASLKKGAAALAALNTTIAAAVASLDPATSTDIQVQTAVDAWTTEQQGYRDHAEIRLPSVATLFGDALSDVSAAAVP